MAQMIPPDPAARECVARRHEVDVERRRAHPGEPRRVVVSDRPPSREDRRGAHGIAHRDGTQR
ncbi:MAG: hypothetical protein ACOZJZ_05970 [Pseudomonadota bacterium]